MSLATLNRDIQRLRECQSAPIEWDDEGVGWRLLASRGTAGSQRELPGLFLTAEETHALLTRQHLLANLDVGGLPAGHIEPLMRRLGKALSAGTPPNAEVTRRIAVQTVGARRIPLPHFQWVGSALWRRLRLVITYRARLVRQVLRVLVIRGFPPQPFKAPPSTTPTHFPPVPFTQRRVRAPHAASNTPARAPATTLP